MNKIKNLNTHVVVLNIKKMVNIYDHIWIQKHVIQIINTIRYKKIDSI